METDESLYERYLNGVSHAADELVARHSAALTLYLDGYLHDPGEAEDLMIEAFALLFVRERPICGGGCFRAYLYKTARNLALRHLRRRRFRILPFEELPFEPVSDALTEDALLSGQRRRTLWNALTRLKPEYREALYLVYFDGLDYRSTARVMGKNEQQVTNLVHRGKQSLKKILEQEGFSYDND